MLIVLFLMLLWVIIRSGCLRDCMLLCWIRRWIVDCLCIIRNCVLFNVIRIRIIFMKVSSASVCLLLLCFKVCEIWVIRLSVLKVFFLVCFFIFLIFWNWVRSLVILWRRLRKRDISNSIFATIWAVWTLFVRWLFWCVNVVWILSLVMFWFNFLFLSCCVILKVWMSLWRSFLSTTAIFCLSKKKSSSRAKFCVLLVLLMLRMVWVWLNFVVILLIICLFSLRVVIILFFLL